MKCLNCGGECEVDEANGTYYCESCNYLFGDKEVQEFLRSQKKVKHKKSKEDLGIISNIILSCITTLPIVDMIVVSFMAKTNIADEYKQTYIAKVLSRIFIIFGLMFFYSTVVLEQRDIIALNVHETVNTVHEFVVNRNKIEEQSQVVNFKDTTIQDLLERIEPVLPEDEISVFHEDNFLFMEDAVISGTNARMLIQSCEDKQVALLVNTKAITSKYGADCYANFAYLVSHIDLSESKSVYLYTGDISDIKEYYTDDLGEYVYRSMDYLDNSKYIYYINKSRNYKVNIVSHESIVVAVILTEV